MQYSISKLRLFLFTALGLTFLVASGQEKKRDTSDFKVSFIPVFGFDRLIQNTTDQRIHAPDNIIRLREEGYSSQSVYVADRYVDFPQTHWSFFGGINTRVLYKDILRLDAAFIGENQSSSFGVLGFDDFLVYPRLTLRYHEEFQLFKRPLGLEAVLGDLIQFKNRNGLLVYNLDGQGGEGVISYANFYYGFLSIADLSQHIGIGIQEWYSHKIGYSGKFKNGKSTYNAGLAWDILIPLRTVTQNFAGHVPSAFVEFKAKKGLRTYAEFGYRLIEDNLNYSSDLVGSGAQSYMVEGGDRIAALIGIDGKLPLKKKHQVNYQLEGRYYGRAYTKGLFDYKIIYREDYGQYRGDFLYPLVNAYRPFDQFAVYSEFQDINVGSLNLRLQSLFTIYKRLKYRLNVELLGLHTFENDFMRDPFLYTFYETGIVFQISKNIEASLYVSNKVMNLDLSYQTFYQSKLPLIGYSLRSKLPF